MPVPWAAGVAQHEAISKCLRNHPVPHLQILLASPPELGVHWPKGCVYGEDFLGYFICIHINLQTKQQSTANCSVDELMLSTQPRAPAHLLGGTVTVLPAPARLPHRCWPCPTARATRDFPSKEPGNRTDPSLPVHLDGKEAVWSGPYA